MKLLDDNLMRQAMAGRKKLRAGSMMVLGVLVVNALLAAFFVATAHPAAREFGIHPTLYSILVLISFPFLIIGVWLMINGYRQETRIYREELKKVQNQIDDALTKH
jgi:uncharacterized membrane protein YozB (DUF420 family)